MKRKTIDSSREVRLWVSQILIPVASIGVTLMTIPEFRNAIVDKSNKVKQLFHKNKS